MAKRTPKRSAKKATKKSTHKPTAKEPEYFVVAEDISNTHLMSSDGLVSGIDGSMEIPFYTDLDDIKRDMMDSDYIAAHPIIYKLVPVCMARKGVSFEIL